MYPGSSIIGHLFVFFNTPVLDWYNNTILYVHLFLINVYSRSTCSLSDLGAAINDVQKTFIKVLINPKASHPRQARLVLFSIVVWTEAINE